MEFDIGIILPLGIEKPFALGQVNQVPVLILRDIGLLVTGKVFQLFGVPCSGSQQSLVKRQTIHLYRSAILPVKDDTGSLQTAVLLHSQ